MPKNKLQQRLFRFATVQDLYDCLTELLKDPNFNSKQSYVFGFDDDQILTFVIEEETNDLVFSE